MKRLFCYATFADNNAQREDNPRAALRVEGMFGIHTRTGTAPMLQEDPELIVTMENGADP